MSLPVRVTNAIRGAFVGDAAAMGTHWIYDPAEMAKAVPSVDAPEFKDPPTPSFYSSKEFPGHYEKGMLSPYGAQLMFATKYTATVSEVAGDSMSTAMLEWANTFGGRPDHATKTFVENMGKDDGKWPNCGADDNQAHCYMKVVPVTCRYAGKSECADKVKEAIQVHQKNDQAVAFGLASSRILELVLLGSSISEALDKFESECQAGEVLDAFVRAKEAAKSGVDLSDFLTTLSNEIVQDKSSGFYNLAARSCALPGSFIAPVFQMFVGDDYTKSMRKNIMVSGDTCSRAVFLGAVLAAADCVPDDWSSKVDPATMEQVESSAKDIVKMIA